MNFQYPYALLLLIPVWIWAFIYYKNKIYLKKMEIRFPGRRESTFSKFENLGKFLPILRPIAISLMILSLSGPGKKITFLPDEKEGVDILIALDVSGSMSRSRDFLPETRLGVSKKLLKRFIEKRNNDRLGLVVFAGAAYLQAPLTGDRESLSEILETIEEETVTEQGTAIGDAIILSTYRLRNSKARSKVIVLITDGVSNTGKIDPVTATDLAEQIGAKIYSVGIGKEDGSYEINFEILQELSAKTGGRFFRAEDPEEMKAVLSSIDSLEKDPLQSPPKEIRETEYEIWLYRALAVLLLDLILRAFFLRYYV
ncbi:PF06707 family protein [Leptospira interrogans str. 2003000735]|uniref:PF06707 family protein n=2 Tax=Leptospira interrogans TaxID=173 RepID=N1UJU6_LEPIR|nr:VWA domain-containing protein [Leptospira interrogans]EMY23949.1 PF06707 family protein [Leptospira interrogans serovar Australis str. 200703203]EKN90031.1 PF06707 family protein [Leptospira interrogans str. 2002000624]EKQ39192.1 PF06707 family protein [Leptospira interrogans str. 2002000621]EKQ49480.1 PF06707 family protein [Leptospira interrogans str. 2002000623]EMJ67847.1 PF06707 family protein [Leptospira interrogans str. 2003000735]